MRHHVGLIVFKAIVLLASFLLTPAPVFAQKTDVNRWAILIGVDDYIEANDLKYCGADMRSLRDHLVASGFPKDQVFLLHDKAKDRQYQPYKSNIEKQLKIILGLVQEDDILVLAFSGHGVHIETTSYLCPADADLKDSKSLISLDAVYGRLKNCEASMKLLLVDACRNDPRVGGQKSLAEETRQFARSLERERPPEGVVLLNSCAPGEISWEEQKFGHGVFMHYLLEGLEGQADEDKNGKVSLGELSSFARRKTGVYVARRFNDSQRPFLKAEGDIRALNFDLAEVGRSGFINSIGMKLVEIPAGEFLMGSPESEEYRDDDDEQQHRVRLSKSFYLQTTEVTQGQWRAVMGTEPWKDKSLVKEGSDYAASYVNWEDATEYCGKLSAKEGRTYRLPTEAEWEYACRCGTTTAYSFGGDASSLKDYAWFDDNADDVDEKYAHQVGQKRPNAWGLYDMHGNVWEWCSDWYGEDYYGNSPSVDPSGPSSGSSRVLRGGSWLSSAQLCRSAFRVWNTPSSRNGYYGFRVVCVLE